MSEDGPDSLVLRYLRQIDRKVDRLIEDVQDLNACASSSEELGAVHRRDLVRLQMTIDRHDERLDRLERRADLIPGA